MRISRSVLNVPPKTRSRQAITAAPKIELVPMPDPLGKDEKIVKSRPPPKVLSQSPSGSSAREGPIPARISAALANAAQSCGS